jgi:transcriptional regulator with XRE-family HTH domain
MSAADASVDGAAKSGLGERLRRARTEQGVSLRELARRLELSASLLSQIETGKIQPSVRTLYAIVTELGVSFDEMFAPHGEKRRRRAKDPAPPPAPTGQATEPARHPAVRVQRAGEGRMLELQSGVRWELLASWRDLELEFRRTTYQPGSASSDDGTFLRHNGREFGFVLEGTLRITLAFDEYVLGPGDSISFDSTIPHRLSNDGDEPVHAIWVEVESYAPRVA